MRWRFKKKERGIDPDEIFLDDRNIPNFNTQQFEGRIERPISKSTILFLGLTFFLIGSLLFYRAGVLQIREGEAYTKKSEANRLDHQLLFPERGIILDRNGIPLAWNTASAEDLGFSLRQYIKEEGFGGLLGYLHYPARDKKGVYYRTDYEAYAGVEEYYNEQLKGKRGLRIIETDALGNMMSSNVIDPPQQGDALSLTIDKEVQSLLYDIIKKTAQREDYLGGAGILMDVTNGEIIALVSYPDFDPNIMTTKDDQEAIRAYGTDPGTPFLNRTTHGLFTPGSIVKPMFAIGALNEGVITPVKLIHSIGYITIPNPYFTDKESRFNDWKNHGSIDTRDAIAQSSDVYFYEIAGGFQGQKGIGIRNLEKYARMFGYGSTTGIDLHGEVSGILPNPEWKKRVFPDDPTWRVGDTYFTGIGQYGMQISPLQAVKEASMLATKGAYVRPHLNMSIATPTPSRLSIPEEYFVVSEEGMRLTVTKGTASLLNIPQVKIAAKTGTAELGVYKTRVNSWVIGYYPYENPKYAFAIVMDRGKKGNTTNATYVAREFFTKMSSTTPQYIENLD